MMFGTRAKIIVIVGLSFALVFLALGISELRRPTAAKPIVASAAPTAPVLPLAAATRDIRVGETITADMIRTMPGDSVHNGTIASPVEALNKVAKGPIAAGALIARTAVGSQDQLAIRVPVGMRAISIDTTDEIAVAGLIKPGDRVDVQVVYPGEDAINGAKGLGRSRAVTLLQMIPVLAVGVVVIGTPPAQTDAIGGATAPPPQPARTVTLALTPEQVSTLSLAKSLGGLYLALRNPADEVMAVAPPKAAPSQGPAVRPVVRAPRMARAKEAAGPPIELVVGDRRELIYSGRSAK